MMTITFRVRQAGWTYWEIPRNRWIEIERELLKNIDVVSIRRITP